MASFEAPSGEPMLRETNHPLLQTADPLTRPSASERIRYRLTGANVRYHANDNICAFIEEGELDELTAEVRDKMEDVLRALVIDTASDHNTSETAQRVARMLVNEVFRGRYVPMPPVTEFLNVSRLTS
jgi:GTP cyclohydrolase I